MIASPFASQWRWLVWIAGALLIGLAATPLTASDHADPISLDNNAKYTSNEMEIKEGGEWKRPNMADRVQWYSGVRDDPFIFPMFFGTNVIAMVMSIPLDCFPGGQQDFLFWGTSHHRGT